MFDGKAFGAEIVGIVKGHIERSLAPLSARLDAMEKRLSELPAPKDGQDGKNADPEAVASIIADNIRKDFEELRASVEAIPAQPDVPAMIEEALAASEGRVLLQCNAMVDKRVELEVAALPPAEKGKDADPVEVAAQVASEVERAVAALPAPQDGKSVTVEELRPMVEEAAAKAVAALPVAKNGVDAVDVIIDREGSLVFTMSDGKMKNVGLVVGRDGKDVDMAAVEKSIADGLAAIPEPKNGADGVGFDDMDMVETEQGIFLRFTRGDVVKDFRLPIVTDRGVFKEGSTYRKGDGVTWGGSFWIAQDETVEKPDSGKGWRLAVKKGRDGKDGTLKPPPKPGPVKVS